MMLQDLGVPVEELGGVVLAEHVVAHLVVAAGELAQLGDPVRVGQEPHVDDEVGVDRQAVLEAERHARSRAGSAPRRAPSAGERRSRSRGAARAPTVAGVEDQVGLVAQPARAARARRRCRRSGGRRPAAGARAARSRSGARARRRAPRGTAPAGACPRSAEVADDAAQVAGERPAAHVHDDGEPGDRAAGCGCRARPACAISSGGRLSTTKKPRSSKHFAAVLRPAPDSPVTTTVSSAPARCVAVALGLDARRAPLRS